MSLKLQRASSTVSSHTSVQSSADHTHHYRLDGAIGEETGADQSSLVNSTTGTHTASMSPNLMSSPETGRELFIESSHISDQSATGHSCRRVEDVSHHIDTCNTSVIEETGTDKSSLVNSTANTQTAPIFPGTMSSSPDDERASSTASLYSSASYRSDRAGDASHRAATCHATTVEERGARQRSWVDLTTRTQMVPSSHSKTSPSLERALSASNISDQNVTFPTFHSIGKISCQTDTSKVVGPAIVGETGGGKNRWPNWFIRVPTSSQGAAYPNYHEIEEASRRADTYNVVIFGETGSGKSSLVNLITGKEQALTSPDTMGCTTKPTVYEHDVKTQETIKVQLFDTAGLDEGSQGRIPTIQVQRALKTLLKTLKKNRGIHLLIYCAQGAKNARALQRNYKLMHSKVKGKVPIVLVVTALEEREPEMEDWWRKNETSISDLGMNFAGHACITTLTITQDDTDELKRRHEQSYDAVRNLFEHCRPQNRTRVHKVPVTTVPPTRKTKNIVLFGEAGAGKSSVVNLMAGKDVAYTSPGMRRCTLQWQDYTIDFGGESYKVFDTIGIEESGLEMEEYLVAVANAYRFIKTLDAEGGVDLLLFCIRAGRFTAALQSNYRFFYEFLCEKKVPIVLAITNLEREQKMEDWWDREHSIFPRYGIHVAGHACITAASGLDGRHQELYEESRIAIRTLVKDYVTGDHNNVWTGGNNVFVSLVRALKKLLVKNTHIRKMNLTGQLTKRCGVPRETAGLLADMIEQGEVRVDTD